MREKFEKLVPKEARESISQILSAKFFNYLTAFIYGVAGVRILGADGFGQLILIISVSNLISSLLNLRLSQPVTKAIRGHLENSRLSDAYQMVGIALWSQFILAFLFGLIFLVFLFFGAEFWELFSSWQTALGFFGFSKVLYLIRDNSLFMLHVNEYWGWFSIKKVMTGILFNLAVIPFMFGGVTFTCFGFLVVEFLIIAFVFILQLYVYGMKRIFRVLFSLDITNKIGELVSVCRSNYSAALFGSIYTQIQKLLLGDVVSPASTAYFVIGKKLTKMGPLFVSPVQAYLFPKFIEKWVNDKNEFFYTLRKYFLLTGTMTIFLGISLGFVAFWFYPLFYGEKFIRSTYLFWILIPGMIIQQIMSIFTRIVLTINEARQIYLSTIFKSFAGLALAVIFIPIWEDYGAAFATSLTGILLGIYQMSFLTWKFRWKWIPLADRIMTKN